MSNIRDGLIESNPWWKGDFDLEYKDREAYDEIQKFIALPQIVALTGLRRVGKTTLMFKMAKDAITKGLDPKAVVYFSFDEFHESPIREVLRGYETIMREDLGAGRHLILLDEVQKLRGWEDQLKAVYDRYRKKLKIIISGSESLFIRKGSRESLAGRIFEFKIDPLSFREYLFFLGIKYEPLELYERELARLFDEFMLSEGFPELVGVKDKQVVKKYLRESIVEKVIFRDLSVLLAIRNVASLESLLNILMEEPGQLVEISELAGQLGISRQTLSDYLYYLEQSFLVRKLYNYSTGRRKVERKLRKYYPTVASVDMLFRDDDMSRSRVLETVCVNQLKAEFFWRDKYKNEVDMVLTNNKPIPIEVKHGKPDLTGLNVFMRKFSIKKGYIVSRDIEEKREVDGKEIFIVPAYKYFLTQAVKI